LLLFRITVIKLPKLATTVAALSLCALALPRASFADTINFMGTGKGEVVSIHSPMLGDLNVRAGELLWSAGSPIELPLLFYAYCVDANNWLRTSQMITIRDAADLDIPGVEAAGEKAAWLINTYAPAVHSTGSNLDAAALQIAIWGALYNPSGDLTDGPFRLNSTGAVATVAQNFLDSVFAAPAGFSIANRAWLDTASGQDQMIPAPEPGSLLLTATGLLAAWRIARRKRED
jgi:hypothetical protein